MVNYRDVYSVGGKNKDDEDSETAFLCSPILGCQDHSVKDEFSNC